MGGLNENGLSCGSLTLTDTVYPFGPSPDGRKSLFVPYFCRWVLEQFSTVEEVRQGLNGLHVFEKPGMNFAQHFIMQDAQKGALVVEWLQGKMNIHSDPNDGISGFGILTNEPPYEWQVRNVQHHEWKRRTMGGGGEGNDVGPSAVSVPGTYYPDERFVRIHVLKKSIEQNSQPQTYREAITSAVSVLNSVQVPIGNPPGVDAANDHTKWAVVRDHKNKMYYIRSTNNPSLQRVDFDQLSQAFLPGRPLRSLAAAFESPVTPWYNDVSNEICSVADGSCKNSEAETPLML